MKRPFSIRKLWTVAILSIALVLPLAATARPPGGGGGLSKQIEMLDLDAETQARVDQILDASRTQRRALHREMRAAREQMREQLASAESDEASLLVLAENISALDLEMEKQRIATHLELRAVLTSDQMEALAAAMPERHARAGRRFQN